MKEQLRNEILSLVCGYVDDEKWRDLATKIDIVLNDYNISANKAELVKFDDSDEKIINQFVASKRLEGLSENTLKQYCRAINHLIEKIGKHLRDINTNDIRFYLAMYQESGACKATVDNERRYFSSFFTWLTDEDYIVKNPMSKIKRIKQETKVKKAFSDNDIERLRLSCKSKRSRALLEFLLSTGCRVGEVVNLSLKDVNFQKQECIVYGKGGKERVVYISDRCMFYLNAYLQSRKHNGIYLFTNNRCGNLSKSSIQGILKRIGECSGVDNVHPHRFRRTFATNALNKGMPIQHIQCLMGHTKIETTLIYCNIDTELVKTEHRRVS